MQTPFEVISKIQYCSETACVAVLHQIMKPKLVEF